MKACILNLLVPVALTYSLIISPATVNAQKTVKRTIVVTNGDTLINGKRLAEMSKSDREQFKKEFSDKERDQVGQEIDAMIRSGKRGEILVQKLTKGGVSDIHLFKLEGDGGQPGRDSLTRHQRGPLSDRDFLEDREDGPPSFSPGMKERHLRRDFDRPHTRLNTQIFEFSNTGKDGFITHVNMEVSNLSPEELKDISGKEPASNELAIEDFTLFPSFSTGKTNVSFNLATKGTTTISITDSDKKILFTDKINGFSGAYLKPVNMVKNGIYYISINQNGKGFMKKIIRFD